MKKIFICLIGFVVAFFATSCSEFAETKKETSLELIIEHDQVLLTGEAAVFSFNYKITDPVEGGQVEVVLPVGFEWLKVESVKVHDESYGLITIRIEENAEKDNIRNAVVTVKYRFDGKSVSKMFNLIQEFIALEYELEAQYGMSAYYGNQYGYYNHLIYLTATDTESPVDGYFKLDLFTRENSTDMRPLPGVYTVVDGSYATETDFAISDMISNVKYPGEDGKTESVYFEKGQVTIERNGNLYTIVGELYGKNGGVYRVRLENKEFSTIDVSHDSRLEADVDETYTDMFIDAFHVGSDLGGINTNAWLLYIVPNEVVVGSPLIQLYLAYDLDVTEAIEPGEFVASYSIAPNTFLPGFFSAEYAGAWLSMYNEDLDRIPVAPMKTGKVELIQLENGNFDIKIESEDDNDHSIKITCTNAKVKYTTKEDLKN